MIGHRLVLLGVIVLLAASAQAQAPKRVLMLGQDVKPGDHVKTGAGEQQALLSPDGASLIIGPDSDVALDALQYDPAAKQGLLALTVGAGSLRFGGGMIAKANDVVVTTGASLVKIHGATAVIGVRPEGAEIRMLIGERVSVTAEGATQTMAQPDSVILVPVGQPPSPPSTRSAGTARASDQAKALNDLDNLSRTTNRIIESSTPRGLNAPGR